MPEENYEYALHANAGSMKSTLIVHNNGEVECDLHNSAMGNQGFHYRLYGKQEPFTDAYGWIHIHRVEDVRQAPPISLPIEALGREIIYEYVKLPRSRLLQHPGSMLWLSAHWTEFFDLILFVNNFVWECIDGLKYAIAEDILDETVPAETRAHINDTFVEHLTTLLHSLDKMKFLKIDSNSKRPT